MPDYKVVNATQLDADMESLADSIRAKAGVTEKLAFPAGMKAAVDGIQTGSDPVIQPLSVTANGTYTAPVGVDGYSPVTVNVPSSGGGGALPSVSPKEVNFYDYDGTVLYSYTVADAAALTELPALPEHDGLICQGWNWTLADIKAMGRAVNVGAMYITDDGKTRIYITLHEGRTSPMLGCCPNGTVTVDWGDGTEPDVLTGTSVSTVQWTPNHEYAAPGDYVITLTVDGMMGFYGNGSTNQYSGILRYASGTDTRNWVYLVCVKKIEIGLGVTTIDDYAFYYCRNLRSVSLPRGVTTIEKNGFTNCYSLSCVNLPDSVTTIGSYVFRYCYSLETCTIPCSITSLPLHMFYECATLSNVTIPDGVTTIGDYAFYNCGILSSVTIPDGVTTIGDYAFNSCYYFTSVTIPDSVTTIESSAFSRCYSVRYYDFSRCTTVPTLSGTGVFANISADCEIRVPAALADEWKAATNWSTYADYIVGV